MSESPCLPFALRKGGEEEGRVRKTIRFPPGLGKKGGCLPILFLRGKGEEAPSRQKENRLQARYLRRGGGGKERKRCLFRKDTPPAAGKRMETPATISLGRKERGFPSCAPQEKGGSWSPIEGPTGQTSGRRCLRAGKKKKEREGGGASRSHGGKNSYLSPILGVRRLG